MRTVNRAVWPMALVSVMSGVASAQTELYFSEYMFQGAQMRAIKPDATGLRTMFLLPPDQWLPLGITYRPATQRLIWMDSAGASEVRSAARDGSGAGVVAPVDGFARGVSLDATGRIYYSTDNELHRMNADGSNDTTLFVGQDVIGGPKVDATNGHVYVGADNHIVRVDLDGTNVKTVVTGCSQPRAIALDVAHGLIYWIDADTHTDFVGRARLDDTDFTVLIDNSPGVGQSSGLIDLLVDPASSTIFYADELTTSIRKTGLGGENPTVIYISPPTGLAPSGLVLSTGEVAQGMQDCNGNGIPDDVDIAGGAPDCNNNGVIDTCEADACPPRTMLLDQGSDAADFNGRALGAPSQWQIFQPFIVPAGGWRLSEIAIDGYTVERADQLGITARLYPDDGSGTKPNETQEIASAHLDLRYSTNFTNWQYAPMQATLPAGRFWVRIEANNPIDYSGSINLGLTGLQSKSRGASGSFTSPTRPIALRLIQRPCPADLNGDGIVDFGDYLDFLNRYDAGDPSVDYNHDGIVDFSDYLEFLNHYDAGC